MNKRNIAVVAVIFTAIASVFVLANDQTEMAGDPSSSSRRSDADFIELSSRELSEMLAKKDFFFVNVHTPYEGEIKNTDAFINYDKVAENLDKLPQNKNAKIVLYCRSGRMSEIAAEKLSALGYTNVAHLAGGMIDWERSGYGTGE